VSEQHFAEHLDVMRKHFHPISVSALADALRTKRVPDRAVAVTFDDGYADNLYAATPLLERLEIPATVFVISGYVDASKEYWWDELERILLRPGTLPRELRLSLDGTEHRWELGAVATYTEEEYAADRHRRVWQAAKDSRLALFYDVWQKLQPLFPWQQEEALGALREWACVPAEPRSTHRPMSSDELVKMERGGLVSVGAHTVHHPLLSSLPAAEQEQQIVQSKRHLERILSHPVREFSYPFGAYAEETVPMVRAAGFSSACATVEEAVWRRSDPFQLPRLEVGNWDGETFEKNLREWFTT
jgi:peptidoglycan/xylan/chitin deacetylase (PgdA/CDA1 family)